MRIADEQDRRHARIEADWLRSKAESLNRFDDVRVAASYLESAEVRERAIREFDESQAGSADDFRERLNALKD